MLCRVVQTAEAALWVQYKAKQYFTEWNSTKLVVNTTWPQKQPNTKILKTVRTTVNGRGKNLQNVFMFSYKSVWKLENIHKYIFLNSIHLIRWFSLFDVHKRHLGNQIKFRLQASSLQEMWISRFGMEQNPCIFTEHTMWILDLTLKTSANHFSM